MVLTDDNFASIVNAVEEGRGIFDNIQKFVVYLLTCNAGEVIFMFATALAGWPTPLAAIQILWINLVTDGLPALALGMEAPEPGIMSRPPRPPREPVLTWSNGRRILLFGALVAAVSAIGFGLVLNEAGGGPEALPRARTVAFSIMAFSQLALAFGFRSQRFTLPELGPFSNRMLIGAMAVSAALQLAALGLPFARPVFQVTEFPADERLLILILSLVPVTLVELGKILAAWWRRGATEGPAA
jgi:Ca2+-transporting ATPase